MGIAVACKKGAKCIITIDEKTILFDSDKNSTKADIILESGFFTNTKKVRKNQICMLPKQITTENIHADTLTIQRIPAYKINSILQENPEIYNGYLIAGKTESIYIAGPTNLIPEMNLIECDIAVLPVAGPEMDVFEALAATNVIQAKTFIPIGYAENEKENEDAKTIFKKKCQYDTE